MLHHEWMLYISNHTCCGEWYGNTTLIAIFNILRCFENMLCLKYFTCNGKFKENTFPIQLTIVIELKLLH